MPTVFLSPSTQGYNIFFDGISTEKEYMNLITDYIEPYLIASGIQFTRNDPNGTVGSSVRASNEGNYDLHVALHSNASGSAAAGQTIGSDIYYHTNSTRGRRMADIVVQNMKTIYHTPDRVRSLATSSLYELNNTRAPAILAEVAFHDNPIDGQWIKDNVQNIARIMAQSIAEFLEVPFVVPQNTRQGTVATSGGNLNIRSRPEITSEIIGQIPNGTVITIYGQTGNWYSTVYNNIDGYVSSQFVR